MGTRFTPINPSAAAATERADAARNRRKVLAAAERLFAERGVEQVSMDEVAHAAGVGKGTLYRRFGDRSGLAMAVMDASGRALQHEILRGAPPLGPGAPPRERLVAFTDAMVDHLDRNVALLVAVGTNHYRSGVYATYHLHVAVLLRQALPDCDAPVLAHLILAPLAPSLYRHLTQDRELPPAQIAAAVRATVHGIVTGDAAEGEPPEPLRGSGKAHRTG